MKYRYRDPTKIPAWFKYGRIGLALLGLHFAGYFMIKRAFGKMDGSSSITEINENIRDAHMRSLRKYHGEIKVRQLKIKGLTVTEDKEYIIPEKRA